MRNRAWALAAFAAAGILLLTACTSSDAEIAQKAGTGTSGEAGAAAVGNTDGAGIQPDMPQGADSDAGTADGTGASPGGDGVSQPVTDVPGGALTEAASEETQTETLQNAGVAEPIAGDIWSGTYASDRETVTITLTDEKSFAFAFANSGIASTAEIDGNTAVYRGDDYHIVVFEMNEGVLDVTVSSEEDYDASASPINGTYVRQS